MIEMLTGLPAHTVGFKMSGKLHDEDYKKFVPLVDAEIAKDGKVNVLAQLHDFQGWDLHALWDDIKFATTHCTKIERIALVGEKTWEKCASRSPWPEFGTSMPRRSKPPRSGSRKGDKSRLTGEISFTGYSSS